MAHQEEAGFGGNWGTIMSPPPKKTVDLEKILSCMYLGKVFLKFIFNSTMITIFAWLTLVIIREAFLSFEKKITLEKKVF
jgi:hypothetical protein